MNQLQCRRKQMSARNRCVLFYTIASLFVVALGLVSCSKKASLTIISFGGAYQDAQRVAYMKPFSEKTGTQIQEGEYNGEYGLLSQRATAPSGSWDVVSVESGPCMRGGKEGIFALLPARVFEGKTLVPGAMRPYAAGHLVFSTLLAYNKETIPNGQAPQSWQDFWNTKRFPGKRALRNNPRGSLEIALLADGASSDHLYPLDVQRAFRKLNELKPSLVFWDSGAQPIQLLANRTVVMSSAYNGRVWDAVTKEKLPIAWQVNQGLMETEFWAVPKNSAHQEAAFDFIAFSLESERQAEFANMIAYGPTNTAALAKVRPDILSAIPTSRDALPSQIMVDADWWAANESKVSAQWQEWLQKQ
jgi:putative spermidine/putrescine transport system substrate-binding protein